MHWNVQDRNFIFKKSYNLTIVCKGYAKLWGSDGKNDQMYTIPIAKMVQCIFNVKSVSFEFFQLLFYELNGLSHETDFWVFCLHKQTDLGPKKSHDRL